MNTESTHTESTQPVTPQAADIPATGQAEPTTLSAEETLNLRIRQGEEEIAKLKDLYLRAMAETENVRARAKREVEDAGKYATTRFARDIVTIVENLSRAAASISAEARASNDVLKQVGEGLDMTLQELLGIFERNGIKRVHPAGEKFDHNFHQAVSQVESADASPGTVLHVLQSGYTLHDRLLRPAMVTVTAAAKSATGTDA